MRRFTRIASALLALGLIALPLPFAQAESAQAKELTKECEYASAKHADKLFRLTDGKRKLAFESQKQVDPHIEIVAKEPIGGMYIEWGELPGAWTLQAYRTGAWEDVSSHGEMGYAHEYAAVQGDTQLRIKLNTNKKKKLLSILELRVLGVGETPADVQIWQPTHEKADLMLLVGHPDDEYVFMGGTIPTYAISRGLNVVVAFMTCSTPQRRGELLDALWHTGETHYPVIGPFGDRYSYNLKMGYDRIGEKPAKRYVVELLRKYRPEVVVTHDTDGEYGHGMHMVCADASIYAYERAASEKYTSVDLPTWQVKKLYLHLYPKNQIMLNWETPLDCYGGKTALEIAAECYTYHVSQYEQQARVKRNNQWYYFGVYSHDMYDNALFGLYASTVGDDVQQNDFMENIQETMEETP